MKALLALIMLSCLSLSSHAKQPTVIIVIDDIGHSYELGQQAIQLPGPVNYAVLPHSPNGPKLAELAHQLGKEVLLHAPMSTIDGTSAGPGELAPNLNEQQFTSRLQQNLEAIPHVTGLNNHMGSLLTQMPKPMAWLMAELKRQQLYFLDSRTSPLTVAEQTAKRYHIPHLKRDIFLDNQRNPAAISRQFEKLLRLANKQGYAVAIGHPYPETIAVLQQALPALSLRGYKQQLASRFLLPTSQPCQPQQALEQLLFKPCSSNSHSSPALATIK
ncbi:divergent polysaccharide deacetylase family protein [Dasania sp. GY-MA-18]|uniref:Divergent polysaccharide deacetylase family protein n=1 Tax=Dasania phycosphaerae TaxID=2950436 RepID=A0A9J6RMR4_9GAMM|nr:MULTISPECIES: divergent polysaccharide deacetylase family protein [Dasania]MCR8923032.1 divergent polysaccharide deacetylase family protein [Dasania sp. GY-MA-18]MCZ0865463.1 divergent polysaccharide deacetylase family protein [Dasania phycosphaerae]MCZ0869188.1 divergent polysaccharide deacetylase family protein [Dasania phycosphaerae]